ncbi:hypothetical protein, partial [Roseisalinus antarcticus]|uniref:hypothetical protein n=1 Tax=Roseisalinus antarcticus TaxID=254357 RepID=UPI001F158221
MALRKIGPQPRHLSLAQPIQIAHHAPFGSGTMNHADRAASTRLMGPEPMQELEKDNAGCFDDLHDEVISVMHSPPASSIQLSKTWLFELFVRGVVPLTPGGLKEIVKEVSSNLDERQMLLARSRLDDKNCYRKSKTGFTSVSPSQQPCLIWGCQLFAKR